MYSEEHCVSQQQVELLGCNSVSTFLGHKDHSGFDCNGDQAGTGASELAAQAEGAF